MVSKTGYKYSMIVLCLSLILISPFFSSCASTHKKTTTVSETTTSAHAPATITKTETQTTTTDNTTTPKARSGIGAFFGAVGAVLAFPFKLVASIIEAIF